MNFHKTIGFLASFLLVLGLGVPDSYAQDLTGVTISLNGTVGSDADPPTPVVTIADNIGTTVVTVSVTATYDDDLTAGDTRTVMVNVKDMMGGTTAEAADYASQPAFPLSITATVAEGALTTAVGSATIILTPVADDDTDDELVVLEASIGDETDEAILQITDSEVSVSTVTLTLNGVSDGTGAASIADNAGATVVAVTVSVDFESPLPTGETRTVMVGVKTGDETTAEAGDYSSVPSLPLTITLTGDGTTDPLVGTTSIAVTPARDADYDNEAVVLEATVENSATTGEATLTITDVDISVESVSLSLNGTAGSDADPPIAVATVADDAGATAVTVGVSVTFESPGLATGETRTVMVGVKTGDETTAEAGDYSTIPSLPVSITFTGGDTPTATLTQNVEIALTPVEDTDQDNENVVLEATVEDSEETDEAILTITDSDNSATAVVLSLNGTAGSDADPPVAVASIADNIGATIVTVGVSVTFENALADDETRTVMVGLKDDQGDDDAEAGDYSTTPAFPVSITVTGDGTTNPLVESLNIVLEPRRDVDDDDENIVLEATIGGADPDEAILEITDSMVDPDPVAGAVTAVAFDPAMLSLTEGMAFTGTSTLTLTVDAGLAAMHEVTLSVAEDVNGDGNMDADDLMALGISSSTVTVSVALDATEGTADVAISYTPPEDANSAAETITITGTVGGQSGDLTLNIADNDMGGVTSVAFSPDMLSLDEGMATTATVTVTVEAVAGPAQTVMVALSSDTPLPLGTVNSPVAVEIGQDATEGTANVVISYTPPEDDNSANETITITGTGGGMSGTLALNVTDNDMGAVTSVAFDPDMLSLTEGTAVTTTVTVTVNVVPGAAADHEVTLSAAGATLTDLGISSSTVTVSVAAGDPSGTADVAITYTPPTDADLDDEMVTVTATGGGQSGTLTLNVADNTPSAGTITVSTSLQSIRENSRTRNVVVTAELDAAPSTGTTVMVTVDVIGGATPVQVQIPIVGPATSNTATVAITPVNDEVFSAKSFTVTGSVTGYESGTASIDIIDDDASIGTISVSSDPPSLTRGSGAQTVALTVHVVGQVDTPEGTVVVVNLATDRGTLSANSVNVTLGKHPDRDPAIDPTQSNDSHGPGSPGTANLTLTADEVDAGGTVTVTASSAMYDSGTDAIPIRVRDGVDVQGYRLVLVKPAADGWANDNNDQVIVDVIRVGSVAYPWTDFQSIRVSVRDTAHDNSDPAHEIDWVMASNFNMEDNGDVTFDEVHAGNSRGDVIWRDNDTIRFEIQIHHCNGGAANNAAGARDAGACGSAEPSSNGQYLGAYVTAEFNVGGDTSTLSNMDSDKPVYPSNPTLVDEADRYVGDGKMFKVDNLDPSKAAIAFVNVTNADGEVLTSNSAIKVGDEVHVAIAVDGDVLFRESGMRAQIQPQDAKGSYNGVLISSLTPPPGRGVADLTAPFTKTTNFSAAQVITASNDSLRASWNIDEGFFEYKTDDFVDIIGPRGTKFEADNTIGRVLVSVKDQAGNWSNAEVKTFQADSRSPGVSILYPSADPDSIYEHTHSLRFSGAAPGSDAAIVEGQNQDAHLNPLAIVVDEDISSLKVFAVGADTLDITDQMPGNAVNDSTAVYDTSTLSSPKKDEDDEYEGTAFVPSSANRAGTEIELVVLATDVLGNTSETRVPQLVTHDAAPPVITQWFPTNTSLEPDNQFNDNQQPEFDLPEDVDSIAVTFEGSNGSDVTKQRGATAKSYVIFDEFSGALEDDISYDMTIFVRDLAGNVFITPADSSSNMRFNKEFKNPDADMFAISTETDSVIAGQANILTIQAEDHSTESPRNAVTYRNAARISAWDASGGAAESVWFDGTGVTDDADSPDGVAMLSAGNWNLGKRTVEVKSDTATGLIKIVVQHVTSGQGDTAVLGDTKGEIDSLYVGAADFNGFRITPMKDGKKVENVDVDDTFTLKVVPVDRHGNPSVRAFKSDPENAEDSLAVLDTRAKDNAFEYKNGFDVTVRSSPPMKGLPPFEWTLDPEGWPFTVTAPSEAGDVFVQVRIDNTSLDTDDARSRNLRPTQTTVTIVDPLTPKITLWGPNGEDWTDETDPITVPADAADDAMITVRADGYKPGSTVTFSDGTEVTADDNGNAPLKLSFAAGTVTVSATDGRYMAPEMTWTFVAEPDEPVRVKHWADAEETDPVYLVYDPETGPSDYTVGSDDLMAIIAVYNQSADANIQADTNDDGVINQDDLLNVLGSWGKVDINAPATKPIVLAPGINENAEFSLSLGSERVVAGELVAVDVSVANVQALMGYGFALNYEVDKFEFVSVAPADEDLLKSTGGETLFHHIVADGQIEVVTGMYGGTAVSGGGDAVRFVFRVLREFEDNARFEIASGVVFDPSQLQNPVVVAGVLELQSTPREFALHQNFPNPFNPDTTIKYDLAESADVTLHIYNVLGQVVRTLVASEAQDAGRYQIRWNGMDDRGVPVSSGIYFYQISADGKFSDVRKLMLLK